MSAYRIDGHISLHRLFTERRTVPGPGTYVMTGDTELCWHDWCPTSLKASGYDGVSIKYYDTYSDPKGRYAASMVLRREIRDLGTKIELPVELSDFECPRGLKTKLDRPFIHLCGMVAMIVCGDIYRQAWLQADYPMGFESPNRLGSKVCWKS